MALRPETAVRSLDELNDTAIANQIFGHMGMDHGFLSDEVL